MYKLLPLPTYLTAFRLTQPRLVSDWLWLWHILAKRAHKQNPTKWCDWRWKYQEISWSVRPYHRWGTWQMEEINNTAMSPSLTPSPFVNLLSADKLFALVNTKFLRLAELLRPCDVKEAACYICMSNSNSAEPCTNTSTSQYRTLLWEWCGVVVPCHRQAGPL